MSYIYIFYTLAGAAMDFRIGPFKVATYYAYSLHILTEAIFMMNGPGKMAKIMDKLKIKKLSCQKIPCSGRSK